MKIYLDDNRIPIENGWVCVKDYEEFISLLEKVDIKDIHCISFDHDLGDKAMAEYHRISGTSNQIDYDNLDEKTGLDCAKFLIDKCIDNDYCDTPIVYVHSFNGVGAQNILNYINSYKRKSNDSYIRVNPATIRIIPFNTIQY